MLLFWSKPPRSLAASCAWRLRFVQRASGGQRLLGWWLSEVEVSRQLVQVASSCCLLPHGRKAVVSEYCRDYKLTGECDGHGAEFSSAQESSDHNPSAWLSKAFYMIARYSPLHHPSKSEPMRPARLKRCLLSCLITLRHTRTCTQRHGRMPCF